MRRPSKQQIEIACSWLDHNEGEGDEQEACKAVAEWLSHLEQDRILREKARKIRIPVSKVRKALANIR